MDRLVDVLRDRRIVALTGAGCSTESGIPDYRGPGTARRARNPIQYREFLRSADTRRRYWARSAVGWLRVDAARPNPAHLALADLERAGRLVGTITQNVDRLHHRAGSERVIELHGALAEVQCLDCGALDDRALLQNRIRAMNPSFAERPIELAPDGDAELAPGAIEGFRVPCCSACGGVLKPHVVFFGESVPRDRVRGAFDLLAGGDALLVVGSSLTVYSGYRFVMRAADRGIPVAIVNLGETRADDLATVKVEERAGTVLPALVAALARSGGPREGPAPIVP